MKLKWYKVKTNDVVDKCEAGCGFFNSIVFTGPYCTI